MQDRGRLREILGAISNSANAEIIALLSTGEYNTREIARILGRDETDVSRRLTKLKNLGLVEYKWARISGRNVKLYRLRATQLVIDFSNRRVTYSLGQGDSSKASIASIEVLGEAPKVKVFVGRKKELERLRKSRGLLLVAGLPGVGKTTLVAKYYEEYSGPKYWLTISELDYLDFIVKKISLYLASLGHESLVDYLAASSSKEALVRRIASIIEDERLLLVVDDYHKARDTAIRDAMTYLAERVEKSKVIVVSRVSPPELSHLAREVIIVRGLDYPSARSLLRRLGVELKEEELVEAYIATQGHPGLLTLLAETIREAGAENALKLLAQGDIARGLWATILSLMSREEKELLSAMLCFDEPVPFELVVELTSAKRPRRALYALEDKNIVKRIGDKYAVVDLVKTIASPKPSPSYCRKIYQVAGDYYFSLKSIEGVLKAVKYYALSNSTRKLKEVLDYRREVVAYRILDYVKPYREVLEEAREKIRDYGLQGYINYELGVAYYNQGAVREALQAFKKALTIAEDTSDPLLSSNTRSWFPLMSPLGLVSFEEAIREAEKALEEAKKLGVERRAEIEFTVHSNLAALYYYNNMIEEAYREVLREAEAAKKLRDPFYKVIARFHVAVVEQSLGRDAREGLEESYSLFKLMGLKSLAAKAAASLAEAILFSEKPDYVEAAKYARESLKVFEILGRETDSCWALTLLILSLLGLQQCSQAAVEAKKALKQCRGKEGISATTIIASIVVESGEKAREIIESNKSVIEKALGGDKGKTIVEILERSECKK